MVTVDHRRTEHVLAIDEVTRKPVASLMLAADPKCIPPSYDHGRPRRLEAAASAGRLGKHRRLARERGLNSSSSIECRASHDALDVERAARLRSPEPGE